MSLRCVAPKSLAADWRSQNIAPLGKERGEQ
jgi:hypothetical protein